LLKFYLAAGTAIFCRLGLKNKIIFAPCFSFFFALKKKSKRRSKNIIWRLAPPNDVPEAFYTTSYL